MLRRNWQIEFGEELGAGESQLRSERVAICDGRMGPLEWLRSSQGDLLKLNYGNYGNNHFFPRPLRHCVEHGRLHCAVGVTVRGSPPTDR